MLFYMSSSYMSLRQGVCVYGDESPKFWAVSTLNRLMVADGQALNA